MNGENYIVNKKGQKIAVQVPIRIYEKLVSDSEELYEIKKYRKVKPHKGDAIPIEKTLLIEEIKEAVEKVKLAKQGKLKTKPLSELLK